MIYSLPNQSEIAKKAIDLASEGFICEIRKKNKKRSLNQNRYYWGIVIKMYGQEFGYTSNEVHQDFGKLFLPKYMKNEKEYTKSTTDLNTIEFENYLSECRMFASKGGLYIPEPNEVTEDLINQLESWRY